MEKQVNWSKIDITLLTLIESEFGHWIHRSYLIELFHDSVVYISSSGNDIGVIFVDVHHIFYVFRVPEGKINRLIDNFDRCCQLLQANQTIIFSCYWVVKSNIVVICWYMSFHLFVIRNKKCNFLELNVLFFSCSNIANIKLHLQHTKYIHII